MMLRLTLKQGDEAALLERAVGDALAGGARTADIAAPGEAAMSTSGMGDAVLASLDRLAA